MAHGDEHMDEKVTDSAPGGPAPTADGPVPDRIARGIRAAELDFLSRLPLFKQLSPEVTQRLLQDAQIETAPAKTILLREGEMPDSLFVLLDGMVQLFTEDNGRESTVLILRPVTCFITAAVARDNVLLNSARAVQPSQLLRLNAEIVRQMVEEDSTFAKSIFEDLALNYRNAIRELKNMRAKSAFERLIAWVVAMQAQTGTSEVEIPYDKSLLAARLGMAPETLSRDLARLADFGVTVRGRKLKIHDINKLREFTWTDEWHKPSLP